MNTRVTKAVFTAMTVAVIAIGGLAISNSGLLLAAVDAPSACDRSQPAADPKTILRAAPSSPSASGKDLVRYRDLAAAALHDARATGDFSMNARADAAVKAALAIAPDDRAALKLQVLVWLTYHRFGDALGLATRLQVAQPNDHEIYAGLTDALVEVGEYDAAIDAAQHMIDLRPNTAAYARVSYLRSLHGDTAGAIEAMRLALAAANPRDTESIAWVRVHLGHELMIAGRRDEAERELDAALALLPDYHLALAAKARARMTAGDLDAARLLYDRAQARVPAPDTVIALGDLYASLGRPTDAKRQYDLLEFIERSATPGAATYSRQLAMFWADHGVRLDQALAVARQERAVRADIYADDLLAWCLFKTGDTVGARIAIDHALRLGTRDPRLLYHAGLINDAAGNHAAASRYLTLARQIDPTLVDGSS